MNDFGSTSLTLDPSLSAPATKRWTVGWGLFAAAALALVVALFVWAGLTSAGAPDPTESSLSPSVALVDIGVLVFREGLECVLVLAAITASMTGERAAYRKPVFAGVGVGMVVSVITWFIAVRIVQDLTNNFSALDVQAGTGLLAVVVLLVIMNWFFHNIYWGGWIAAHNRRKKALLSGAQDATVNQRRLLLGLGLLGFTSLYREGFEIVLFLQSYHLKMGGGLVLGGTLLGLFFTGIVAVLTFVAQQRLPYRRMLIFTGILLGVVLLIMVGEQAFEMQQAKWIPTTEIGWLKPVLPDWTGVWLSLFPTAETLGAQGLAATIVVGSYFLAGRQSKKDTQAQPATA
jgi:high-affinity iron transporter